MWALRRLRCWWKGCNPSPQYLPIGPGGAPVKTGWHCYWCGRTVIFDLEKY